jgi:penicillin-binding protein 1A
VRLLIRFIAIISFAALALAATGVALVPAVREVSSASLPTEEQEIQLGPLDQRSYVHAADGSVLATYRAEIDRQPVPLERVPDHLVDAVLAVEDADFYTHDGVNLRSMLRAFMANVDEGGLAQGGSTITQQVVKLELVGTARTLERKAKEAVLARRLEQVMTKDEILERYLNTVYFGYGAYGVQAAAETYFGLAGVEDIDPVQSALLAALIANPSAFDPIRFPEAAEVRRNLALDRMVDERVIPDEARDLYVHAALPTEVRDLFKAPDDYFVEEVKRMLLDDPRLGPEREDRRNAVFRGGLHIYTTLDPRAQYIAMASSDQVLAEIAPDAPRGTIPLDPNPFTGEPRTGTSAVVSIDPKSGAVRAMVGGPGFDTFQFNIVTQAIRQTGSSFKTFVLLALLENGFSPLSTVNGSGPCTFNIPGVDEPYEVQNFDNSYGGTSDITSQTLRSSNCAYVRLGQVVGLDKVVEVARRLGVTAALDPSYFSLPLGSVEVRPIEMAGAYAAIANDGVYNPPYLIERVEDRDGNTLFTHEPAPQPALSPQTSRLAAQILEKNVQSGTGTRASIPGQHAAGKTGTAQGSGDAWFVGFTPHLATAVWMGSPTDRFDVRVFGRGVTGGSYPAEIWGRFMRGYHVGLPEATYPAPEPPPRGEYLTIDREIDPRAGSTTPSSYPPAFPPPPTIAAVTTTAPPPPTTSTPIPPPTTSPTIPPTTAAPTTATPTSATSSTEPHGVPGMPDRTTGANT